MLTVVMVIAYPSGLLRLTIASYFFGADIVSLLVFQVRWILADSEYR